MVDEAMNATATSAEMQIALDVSAVGRNDMREHLRRSVETLVFAWKDIHAFNRYFGASDEVGSSWRLLVAGDLANLLRRYQAYGRHEWITSVRRTRPHFMAFVRTDKDRKCLTLLDDLIRDSDSRPNVAV